MKFNRFLSYGLIMSAGLLGCSKSKKEPYLEVTVISENNQTGDPSYPYEFMVRDRTGFQAPIRVHVSISELADDLIGRGDTIHLSPNSMSYSRNTDQRKLNRLDGLRIINKIEIRPEGGH